MHRREVLLSLGAFALDGIFNPRHLYLEANEPSDKKSYLYSKIVNAARWSSYIPEEGLLKALALAQRKGVSAVS